jgi:hypothetical protein
VVGRRNIGKEEGMKEHGKDTRADGGEDRRRATAGGKENRNAAEPYEPMASRRTLGPMAVWTDGERPQEVRR